jgi:microcystin-dependent protein
MSEPFIGEIRMFAGSFAPRGWAYCDGQLYSVSQNDALFSLFGTIYGGDGRDTFGLPDLRGRVPIHQGTGPGLAERRLGSKAGVENATVTENQLASHTHELRASGDPAEDNDPVGHLPARSTSASLYSDDYEVEEVYLHDSAVGNTGGSQSHSNVMPFLCIHFIVALFGIYPSRS